MRSVHYYYYHSVLQDINIVRLTVNFVELCNADDSYELSSKRVLLDRLFKIKRSVLWLSLKAGYNAMVTKIRKLHILHA